MNKILIITIVVLLLLGSAFYFMSDKDDNVAVTGMDTDAEQTQNTTDDNLSEEGAGSNNSFQVVAPKNRVTLAATQTGNSVVVSSVTLTEPGYVVIYQVDSNSASDVVGSSDLLEPGDYADIKIQLSTPIVGDQTVIAVLHEDDGDRKFEFPESDFYLGNPGQPIVSDVDVVDVAASEEDAELQKKVEIFLENNSVTEAELETN